MAKFGIPPSVEAFLKQRDRRCVYCAKEMRPRVGHGKQRDAITIEHFNFDGPFYWKDGLKQEDLAICCGACNSSRGTKQLPDWFLSSYCLERGINENTVAPPVREYLVRKNPIKQNGIKRGR